MTVVRGEAGWLTPQPPELAEVALIVEVDHNTARTDRVVKYSRYAERRNPVYWIIKAERRIVLVFDTPQGEGAESHYARTQRYAARLRDPHRHRRPRGRARRGGPAVPQEKALNGEVRLRHAT